MDPSLEDIAFLVSSDHRVRVLDALTSGACDRTELRAQTGASSPTIGRILTDFQDRHWIERDASVYRLTDLGAFVAGKLTEFRKAMSHERRFREIWPWLPHEIDDFSVELFTDAVISRPGPGYPYKPIERLTELLTTAESMRGFGMALLKSANLEPFFDQVADGLECEYIYPPAVFEDLLAWNQETVTKTVTRPNYTVLLHDDLPLNHRCGICLFDDRVSICCYDPGTGSLRSLVDTGSDRMRVWADSHYDRYRHEARPLEDAIDLSSGERTQ